MSRERRFHVLDLDSPTVTLDSEEAHHLIHVLRLREGAEVSLFDDRGRAAKGRVLRIAGDEAQLEVLGSEPSRESPLQLTIAVAPPKGDRGSFLVEKLTELGVARIIPIDTDRGQGGGNPERWRRIALQSCKQSGRSRVPTIEPKRSVASVLEEPGRMLAAHPGSPALSLRRNGDLIALVGPEGGWSEAELGLIASRGATLFGLGPRTLRTETAAVAAATLLQYLLADLGS
jgi:16S rRNA (uracil1498-N3)-methyltransferase